MPLRIFIVEDEPLIAATIETALLKQGYLICGEADNFEDSYHEILKSKPDLVLIDINLEGDKDGVDLALVLDILDVPYLYLTSQTDSLTIAKVKQSKPLGYVVKPFTETGLRSNIEIAWNNYSNDDREYLSFTSNNEFHRIKQSQILYLKAFDNYCYVVTQEQDYLSPKTLKALSELLNPELFIKTHRSYIVNVSKITSLKTQSLYINMIKIPISKSHKENLKEKFKI
ncbi:MAG: response regulator transcription factor [Gelidibacter sp.]